MRKRWLLLAGLVCTGILAVAFVCFGGLDCVLFQVHTTVERLLGETPQKKVEAYFASVRRGDRSTALVRWPADQRLGEEYEARRQQVTDELLSLGTSLRYQVVKVEWWRNCCEPAPIDVPGRAGVARMWIKVAGNTGQAGLYIFDVITTQGYWADAGGNPVRRWALRDVYREGESPLAFPIRAEGDRLIWTTG